MMCLANVYFFLDGTARQWYVNNEELDSWEAFKNGLVDFSVTVKNNQKGRRTKMPSPALGVHSTYKVIRTLPRLNPLIRDEKVSHLMKVVAENGVEFHWGPEEVEAFNSLKKATSDPVLGMYDEKSFYRNPY
ncbi:hypothetical protein TNCV_666351 [Trichonephila clavipes]|uniref:Uncharacterized protein n=1 Tax=Trichonephila clavipes TaxID=2585209 RepID=A0A8X6VM30_TRICX|nr:hypothetical protein TNCV_666351 [Trichonephila clavipes]